MWIDLQLINLAERNMATRPNGLELLVIVWTLVAMQGCGSENDDFGPTAPPSLSSGSLTEPDEPVFAAATPTPGEADDKPVSEAGEASETTKAPPASAVNVAEAESAPESNGSAAPADTVTQPAPSTAEAPEETEGGPSATTSDPPVAVTAPEPVPEALLSARATFSSSAETLVLGDGHSAAAFDVSTGTVLRALSVGDSNVTATAGLGDDAVAVGTQSGLLFLDRPVDSAAYDYFARLALVEEERRGAARVAHAGGVSALMELPGEESLASGGLDGVVRVWDLNASAASDISIGQQFRLMTGSQRFLAATPGDSTVKVIELATRFTACRVTVPSESPVRSIVLSRQGDRLAVGDEAGWLTVWSVPDGKLIDNHLVDSFPLVEVRFGKAARHLLTRDSKGHVRLLTLDESEDKPLQFRRTIHGESDLEGIALISPDSDTEDGAEFETAVIQRDGSILTYGEELLPQQHSRQKLPAGIQPAVDSNGQTIAWFDDSTPPAIVHEEIDSGRVLARMACPSQPVELSFHRNDTRLLAADGSGHVLIWDMTTHEFQLGMATRLQASHVTWETDRNSIITLESDGALRHYDVPHVEVVGQLDGPVTALTSSADGNWLVAAATTGQIVAWDRAGKSGPVTHQVDNQVADLVVGSENQQIYLAAGNLVSSLPLQTDDDSAEDLDGVAEVEEEKNLSLPTEEPDESPKLSPFEHPQRITCLSLSQDGKSLLTGASDGIVRVWTAAAGQLKAECHGDEAAIQQVAVTGASAASSIDAKGVYREWTWKMSQDAANPTIIDSATVSRTLTSNEVSSQVVAAQDELVLLNEHRLRTATTAQERADVRSAFHSKDTVSPNVPSDAPRRITTQDIADDYPVETRPALERGNYRTILSATGDQYAILTRPRSGQDGDDKRSVTGETSSLRVWDTPTGLELRRWVFPASSPSLSSVCSDFCVLQLPDARLFDIRNGRITNVGNSPDLVVPSLDGLALAVAYRTESQSRGPVLQIVDLQSGDVTAETPGYEAVTTSVAWAPDGEALVASIRERTRHRLVYLKPDLTEICEIENHEHDSPWTGSENSVRVPGVTGVYFGPRGRTLVTHGEYASGKYRVTIRKRRGERWPESESMARTESKPAIKDRVPGHAMFVADVSARFAVKSDTGVAVVDTSRGRGVFSVEHDSLDISILAGNGRYLVVGRANGRIRVHDLKRDGEEKEFPAHAGPVISLSANPDASILCSIGEEGQLALWALSEWLAPRDLTSSDDNR